MFSVPMHNSMRYTSEWTTHNVSVLDTMNMFLLTTHVYTVYKNFTRTFQAGV